MTEWFVDIFIWHSRVNIDYRHNYGLDYFWYIDGGTVKDISVVSVFGTYKG